MSEADKLNNESATDAPAPSPAAEATPAAAVPRPAGGGRGLAVLALLVGLGGAGLGGYALWQQQALAGADAALSQQLSPYQALPEAVRALGEQDQRLVARLQPLERLPSAEALDEQARLLALLQSQQQGLRERVEQVLGASREQWRLAEAEHLLRMAMLRLSALQDTGSAIALLREADLILRRQDDPGAYAAREQLLSGLEGLRSLPPIDRTGLFLQLGALRGQAAALAAEAPQFQTGPEGAGAASPRPWERWLAALSRYVRIDLDSDAQVKPLLAGQSLAQVRLALALAIEQAQWAVLNGNPQVYRQSVAQAAELLDQQFGDRHEAARALAQRLRELGERQVSVTLPDLTPALRALQHYIDERERSELSAPGERDEPTPAPEAANAEGAPA